MIFTPENFNRFTFSRKTHFVLFDYCEFDKMLFQRKIKIDDCDLKVYQDLLVFAFLSHNIPKGAKILDVGGGVSRILQYFKNDYECWNIDKLEGCGNGPNEANLEGVNLVQDYIGNFNQKLPEGYFDFVFSISALEHVPNKDYELYDSISKDINRILKVSGLSLHCFDVVQKNDFVWTNSLLPYFFDTFHPYNKFMPFEEMIRDEDLFVMSEQYYTKTWQHVTKKTYEDFGKPFSCNILWKKMS